MRLRSDCGVCKYGGVPRYVVHAHTVSAVLTFTYMDPNRVLKKVRVLQRLGAPFSLQMDKKPISETDLELEAQKLSE